MYNWQHKDWANFIYDETIINENALEFSMALGAMEGIIEGMKYGDQQDTFIQILQEEALNTSAIEGEILNLTDVRSSIENKLGLNKQHKNIRDKKAKAVAELMLDIWRSHDKKMSEILVKYWHTLLFDGSKYIEAGKWRTSKNPMRIVSGAVGREIVHYEAPPSSSVPLEMKQFVQWYNNYKTKGNIAQALIKSAIAHLYFESIHPFEDGNGRIGRAIAEKCLSESLGQPIILGLSSVIEKNRKQYYVALKNAQKGLEINDWIKYFTKVVVQAQKNAVKMVRFTLKKNLFFDKHKKILNDRQDKVLKKMWDAGPEGFTGGMTARKYSSITKASKATATRDLQYLAKLHLLLPKGEGRSVYYELT